MNSDGIYQESLPVGCAFVYWNVTSLSWSRRSARIAIDAVMLWFKATGGFDFFAIFDIWPPPPTRP